MEVPHFFLASISVLSKLLVRTWRPSTTTVSLVGKMDALQFTVGFFLAIKAQVSHSVLCAVERRDFKFQ